jgi:hypothetical protein
MAAVVGLLALLFCRAAIMVAVALALLLERVVAEQFASSGPAHHAVSLQQILVTCKEKLWQLPLGLPP